MIDLSMTFDKMKDKIGFNGSYIIDEVINLDENPGKFTVGEFENYSLLKDRPRVYLNDRFFRDAF
jgi:hypothetical protein